MVKEYVLRGDKHVNMQIIPVGHVGRTHKITMGGWKITSCTEVENESN